MKIITLVLVVLLGVSNGEKLDIGKDNEVELQDFQNVSGDFEPQTIVPSTDEQDTLIQEILQLLPKATKAKGIDSLHIRSLKKLRIS